MNKRGKDFSGCPNTVRSASRAGETDLFKSLWVLSDVEELVPVLQPLTHHRQ